jgi:hypothetical protein
MADNSRRKFLKTGPVAVAGAVGAKVAAQGPPAAGPIKPGTIDAAEAIAGLDLHQDEEAAIAPGLNNRLRTFQQLRNTNVPLDTELAIVFTPVIPGKAPKGPATPHAALRHSLAPMTLRRPANLEEVAFWPIARLAALLERRLVSSTEHTQM